MAQKNIEKIETAKDLKAALPDLAAELVASGVASVNTDDITAQAKKDAQAEILALVDAHFGAEAGEKFKALVDTGVTVDQLTAIKGLQPEPPAASAQGTKEKILENLQNTGAENPGSGGTTQPAGFMVLVNQYRAENKCSYAAALRAVTASNPKEHKDYLKGVN